MSAKSANYPKTHRHWLSEAIGSAWKLTTLGMNPPAGRSSVLYAKLQGIAAPHLAILAHKRTRYLENGDKEGWSSELHQFAESAVVLEFGALGANELERVVKTLDSIVVAEQQKSAEASALPATSRFDTSWVT